jgi:hypothetical protein
MCSIRQKDTVLRGCLLRHAGTTAAVVVWVLRLGSEASVENVARPVKKKVHAEPRSIALAASAKSDYGQGMTVQAIKDAIAHLSDEERKQITVWLDDLEEEAWDRQIERDFSPGGNGMALLEEVKADVAAGRTKVTLC